MVDLLALADRVEKLDGPDRKTDVAIWLLMHPDREYLWNLSGMNAQRELHKESTLDRVVSDNPSEYGFDNHRHRFTASLDAAITLVPEGWRCGFEQAGINDRDESPMAWCWPFDSSWEPDWQRGDDSYKGHDKGVQAVGATLALALTAASLHARASTDKGEA